MNFNRQFSKMCVKGKTDRAGQVPIVKHQLCQTVNKHKSESLKVFTVRFIGLD